MSLVLNIGLEVGQSGAYNGIAHTVEGLERLGLRIETLRVVESDTETTAVVEVNRESFVGLNQIYRLAQALGQEAIAVRLDDMGFLVGPQASKWGLFDPAQFFLLDGSRLSSSARPEAA